MRKEVFDANGNLKTSSGIGGIGSSTNSDFAQWSGTGGSALKDGGLSLTTDTTLAAALDTLIPSEKAVKTYVDNAINGLSPKADVIVATAAALPANVYNNGASGVGATLTGVSTGVLTVDGVAMTLGMRLIVKNEATGANNGFYSVTQAGAIGVLYILTRTTDANTSAELIGAYAFALQGTANADTAFIVTNTSTITVGTTAITFGTFQNGGINQLTGDVTAGPGTGSQAATLKNTGTAGTYTKVTFDAQGRETSGTTLSSGDIPNLAASIITSGQLALARGGTHADLSATGAANSFLKQSSSGADVTVGTIATADIATALTAPGPVGGTTPGTGRFSSLLIGSSLNASAVAEFDSTTLGLLPPVMTTTQRNAISSPADGLLVYDSTLHQLYQYQNGAWAAVGTSSGSGATGSFIYLSSFEEWENGSTSSAPTPWVLTGASATVAREGTIIKHGLYSAKVTRAGTDCNLMQDIYVPGGSTYARSRQYTFGAWVYATVASRVRLRVDDGVTVTNSSYNTGASAWEWLTVTVTIGAAITTFKVGFEVVTGNTSGYMDAAAITEGASLTAGYYPTFRGIGTGYALIQEQQAQNTAGGTFTTGADRTRTLNTVVSDTIGVSLASNQFVLPAGTYRIRGLAQAYNCGLHQLWLYNITDSSVVQRGLSQNTQVGTTTVTTADVDTHFTISASKTFELRHRCSSTGQFGLAANFGTEVYTQVEIVKE